MCSELSLGELLQKVSVVARKLEKEVPNVGSAARDECVRTARAMPTDFGAEIGSGFPQVRTALDGEGDLVAAIVADMRSIHAYGVKDASQGDVERLLHPIEKMLGSVSERLATLLQPEISEHVRDVTDALDALGNTTAATGKGFAIGSAVLTASGLIAAYINGAGITVINLGEPIVVAGLLLGAMLPFLFAALTMLSVGRAAEMIILQVRLQLYEVMSVVAKPNGVTSDARWSPQRTFKCLEACKINSPLYATLASAFDAAPDTPAGDVMRWEAVMKVGAHSFVLFLLFTSVLILFLILFSRPHSFEGLALRRPRLRGAGDSRHQRRVPRRHLRSLGGREARPRRVLQRLHGDRDGRVARRDDHPRRARCLLSSDRRFPHGPPRARRSSHRRALFRIHARHYDVQRGRCVG
jgi:hypothetical protein